MIVVDNMRTTCFILSSLNRVRIVQRSKIRLVKLNYRLRTTDNSYVAYSTPISSNNNGDHHQCYVIRI